MTSWPGRIVHRCCEASIWERASSRRVALRVALARAATMRARAVARFAAPAPRTGTESAAAGDDEIEEFLHLFLSNRGVLLTPFHNMALMCPVTPAGDVATHTQLFDEAVHDLTRALRG